MFRMAGSEPRFNSLFIFRMAVSGILIEAADCLLPILCLSFEHMAIYRKLAIGSMLVDALYKSLFSKGKLIAFNYYAAM